MNKKIFAIFALLIVAVSITAVSAFDLRDIFGSSEPEKENVTIDGINFTVSSDFKEDPSGLTSGVIDSLENLGLDISGKAYSDGSRGIALFVVDYRNVEISGEEIQGLIGGNATTINGVDGFILNADDCYVFDYEKDTRLVIVSATDENLIGDFIIA